MKKPLFLLSLSIVLGVGWACSSNDDQAADVDSDKSEPSPTSTGTTTTAPTTTAPKPEPDAAVRPTQWILATLNGNVDSEAVAFGTDGPGGVTGRFKFPGRTGVVAVAGSHAFVLEQAADRVVLLDDKDPTKEVASWSVTGTDKPDGGEDQAQPVGIAVDEARKVAYVARYRRNEIAVIDLAKPTAPVKYVSLSKYLQVSDSDKVVDPTAIAYSAARDRVYVLLGNVDFGNVAPDGYTYLCSALKTKIVSIDPTNDALAEVATLAMHNPSVGAPLLLDEDETHLFALGGGCNQKLGDGGAGNVVQRGLERTTIAGGATATLIAMNGAEFPVTFARSAGTLFVSAFYEGVKAYDGTTGVLKSSLGAVPDGFAVESAGTFVGLSQGKLDDGGVGPFDLVRVGADGGSATTIAKAPFTILKGFPGGVTVFPGK